MSMLWKEVKKVINQIWGRQNIFGYKSTVANQIYLLYCISGNIYFTDKMEKGVKYLWYILVSSELTISYISALMYFLFDEEFNLIIMLYALNFIFLSTLTNFGFTLISYIFSDQIEAIIELVDRILTKGQLANSKQNGIISDMKKTFIQFMGLFVMCCNIYMFICFFDVALFFSEQKVKNNFYYTWPIPSIGRHGTLGLFFCFNGLLNFFSLFICFKIGSLYSIVLYWNSVCSKALIDIRDELYDRSRYLIEDMNKSTGAKQQFDDWNQHFHKIVQHNIRRFQEIILLINYLRMFIEVLGTFVVATAFVVTVNILNVCLSKEVPFVLKLKYMAGALACIPPSFVIYWIGQNLDDLTMEVSTAIYSTPWYCSVKVRRNIYIFLCQTQTVRNLAIIKVYRLLLKNFARYLHAIMSYTNILRRLTLK